MKLRQLQRSSKTVIFSTEDEKMAAEVKKIFEEPPKQVPKPNYEEGGLPMIPMLPLPAYLYLVVSCVVAIAFIGTIFEVSGGKPLLGFPLTWAIMVASGPGFLYLFYCSLKRGQIEEKEDNDTWRNNM
eukprot:CAMPEP_0113934566 /NCGR_PEP_ID=MMETSP1339-20121228/1887_1 /TAXON_ID=94617 /ORGANISM="Fibrocapsa japonica" /LENGTH=127 /DNA_ID=CAMNT_0000936425 /DNA_START=217 /DNA_END=600 /DNA_ORIENTATION=+ /assembly_acc=CAM_ASM_000762